MRKLILLSALALTFTSCKQNDSYTSPTETSIQVPKQDLGLQQGIIVGINSETITEDSSNDRAVNGALIGGIGSYLLSSKPSFTKIAIGAGTGAVIGKTTGGTITQYTTYTLTIRNIDTKEIHTKYDIKSSNYRLKDTINYEIYGNVMFKQ